MSETAISLNKLMAKKFNVLKFTGDWLALVGAPECSGAILIYGDSGNGKTTFALKFMKYLCKFKKCAYIPLEEGTKLTFQSAIKRANLLSVASKIKIWEDANVESLIEDLNKPKSPDFIFIDSIQVLRKDQNSMQEISKIQFLKLTKLFPKKCFICISHSENGKPRGSLAEFIYYMADVCLHVDNFQITPAKSRYGGETTLELEKL